MNRLYSHFSILLQHTIRIIFLGVFTIIVQAQDWPPPGATWVYCKEYGPQQFGTYTYTYTQDTLISGVSYAMIQRTHNDDELVIGTEQEINKRMYFRSSNDTIYRYVNNTEYIFFINSLSMGDQYTAFRTNSLWYDLYSCQPELELTVVGIDEIEVEGQPFTRVTVEDTEFDNVYDLQLFPPYPVYQFIESIGPAYNFPFFHNLADNPDPDYCSLAVKGSTFWEQLLSYSDNENSYTFGICTPSSIAEYELSAITFPNPASDFIHFALQDVEVSSAVQIDVYDSSGKKVLSSHNHYLQQAIDVSALKNGLYNVVIHFDQRLASTRFVKIG